MTRKHGFTLVELLVVIAIIGILLAIVSPQIAGYMRKAKMRKAQAEVSNVDIALNKMLTDANASSFRQFFTRDAVDTLDRMSMAEQTYFYTYCFYELLRQGQDADNQVPLRQEVRTSLGTNYLDLGKDPWDAQYQFWAGPWNSSVKQGQRYRLNQGWNGTTTIPFRIYMPGRELEDGTYQPYVYNQAAKNQADMDLPGNPDPDGAFGFPANDDLEIYVWSMGEDAISNQNFRDPDNYNGYPNDMDPEKLGGGDDIGSWDKTGGFEVWYN